jgi:hypothetical protein
MQKSFWSAGLMIHLSILARISRIEAKSWSPTGRYVVSFWRKNHLFWNYANSIWTIQINSWRILTNDSRNMNPSISWSCETRNRLQHTHEMAGWETVEGRWRSPTFITHWKKRKYRDDKTCEDGLPIVRGLWGMPSAFWDVAPCGSCKNRLFGRMYRLHHQGDKNRRAWNNASSN